MEKTLHNTFSSKHSGKTKQNFQPRYSFFFSFSNTKENKKRQKTNKLWLRDKLSQAMKHLRQWYCMSDQGKVACQKREREKNTQGGGKWPTFLSVQWGKDVVCTSSLEKFNLPLKQSFPIIHFLYCISGAPVKPVLSPLIQNSAMPEETLVGEPMGALDLLYGCRCLLSFYTLKKNVLIKFQ